MAQPQVQARRDGQWQRLSSEGLVPGDLIRLEAGDRVPADGRALARAVRVLGKVEPVFVEQVAELPAAIRGAVLDGDVVLAMGAGSISTVAGRLVQG